MREHRLGHHHERCDRPDGNEPASGAVHCGHPRGRRGPLEDGSRVLPDPILVGRDAAKLARLASTYGVAHHTTDLDAALADPGYAVFFDASSTSVRGPLLERAINAGKHIYCEKPAAASLEQTLRFTGWLPAGGSSMGLFRTSCGCPDYANSSG